MENISNAYTEVLVILQNLEDGYYLIPIEIIEKMKRECNLDYEFKLQRDIPIQEQKLLDETKAILAVFYRDYWASDEQREIIRLKEENDIKLLENGKKEKYNPNDLFRNTIQKPKLENTLIVKPQERVFKKIIIYIKRILKK